MCIYIFYSQYFLFMSHLLPFIYLLFLYYRILFYQLSLYVNSNKFTRITLSYSHFLFFTLSHTRKSECLKAIPEKRSFLHIK